MPELFPELDAQMLLQEPPSITAERISDRCTNAQFIAVTSGRKGAGLCVRAGGASGGDDALAMCIAHVTGWEIQWVYLLTDFVVLGASLSYIPLRRIAYSVLTVLISGQLIGLIQKLRLPWERAETDSDST